MKKQHDTASVVRVRCADAVGGRFSPGLITGLVAFLLGLLLVFGRDVRRFWASHFQPRITFTAGPARPPATITASEKAVTPAAVFEGEVARTEVRLREASAVAIAASLAGLAAYAEGRPVREVKALLREMAERGLLPPGTVLTEAGQTLATESSILHLRLRPQPFAVEVLAMGRSRRDGPALLLRVPEEAPAQPGPKGGSRYFSSLTLSAVKIPAPFATTAAILACGWRADTFRPALPDGVDAVETVAFGLTVALDNQRKPFYISDKATFPRSSERGPIEELMAQHVGRRRSTLSTFR